MLHGKSTFFASCDSETRPPRPRQRLLYGGGEPLQSTVHDLKESCSILQFRGIKLQKQFPLPHRRRKFLRTGAVEVKRPHLRRSTVRVVKGKLQIPRYDQRRVITRLKQDPLLLRIEDLPGDERIRAKHEQQSLRLLQRSGPVESRQRH